MSEDALTPAQAELLELKERLARAIRETREAVAASEAAQRESWELRRHAREVLRRSALRRYDLFQGASEALAELEALTRHGAEPPGTDG